MTSISEIDLARLETLAHTEGEWFESDYWQLRRNLPALLQQRAALMEAAEEGLTHLLFRVGETCPIQDRDGLCSHDVCAVTARLRTAIAAAKGERS